MANSIKNGFIWTAMEKFSIQFVQFVLGIIIARHITPDEYGVLGILMVFVNISQVFIDSGLGSALIYKNDLKERDLQTAFTFNLVVSVAIILLVWSIAIPFESFFEMDSLAIYLSLSIIVLVFNAFIVVPTSILRIRMDFKAIALSNFISTLLSGAIGAVSAYCGLGILALIAQLISKSFLQMIILAFHCKWRPSFSFNSNAFKEMYRYAFSIFGTSCITKISGEGISLFIAKILSPYDLGIFTRATQFATLAGTSLGSIFSTVLFPAFSALKEDMDGLISMYKKMIEYQGLFIIPIFIFLAALSKPLVVLLLTEKWADVIQILQILCVGRILSTISIVTEQAICSVGRSDLEFKQQRDKITLKIISIAIGFNWGIIGIALADAISTLLSFFITNHYAKKCLPVSSVEQLKLLTPFIFFSFVPALISSLICHYYIESAFCGLLCGAIICSSLYIVFIFLFKKSLADEVILKIKLR